MSRTKIVLAGEGGQGVQSIAKILVEAGYEAGKQILYIPNFGVEQRGGVSIAFCQIADERMKTQLLFMIHLYVQKSLNANAKR